MLGNNHRTCRRRPGRGRLAAPVTTLCAALALVALGSAPTAVADEGDDLNFSNAPLVGEWAVNNNSNGITIAITEDGVGTVAQTIPMYAHCLPEGATVLRNLNRVEGFRDEWTGEATNPCADEAWHDVVITMSSNTGKLSINLPRYPGWYATKPGTITKCFNTAVRSDFELPASIPAFVEDTLQTGGINVDDGVIGRGQLRVQWKTENGEVVQASPYFASWGTAIGNVVAFKASFTPVPSLPAPPPTSFTAETAITFEASIPGWSFTDQVVITQQLSGSGHSSWDWGPKQDGNTYPTLIQGDYC